KIESANSRYGERFFSRLLERFRAKWMPVRVKEARQNKNLEFGSDPIRTETSSPVSGCVW
ncbi:hypothetical protein ACFFWD_06035, partial [Bradyrhizobium erythrophlei]